MLCFFIIPPHAYLVWSTYLGNENRDLQLLVTTNDSRIRLIKMDDFSMTCKYKGHVNDNMQIEAQFCNDGSHIICGSEDNCV